MHAYSLAMGSLLGHPWAADILKRAQRLVTYFQASTRAYSKLLESAKILGLPGPHRLQSYNKTRFTSVQMMLQSVISLETAFRYMLNTFEGVIRADDIKPIIRDRLFWASAEVLNRICQPFCKVMMAIQAKTATLADIITRYWLYLARVLKEELPKVAAAGGESSLLVALLPDSCHAILTVVC